MAFNFKQKIIERKTNELQNKIDNFERSSSSFNVGLTDEDVTLRKEQGLYNYRKKVVTKSWWKMIYDNFFTFFNVLIYIFAAIALVAGKYNQLLFLAIILANSAIGIIQDIRARKLVEKLSIVNNLKATVIRNSEEIEIPINDIVLDDVIFIKNGDQVPCDATILKGKCSINESMLTGEPDSIKKKLNDTIYAGTYVTSGSCYARVKAISYLNRAEQIQAKASMFKKTKSEILRSIKFLFKFLGVAIIILGVGTLFGMWYCLGDQFTWENLIKDGTSLIADAPISKFIGSMVSMIPSGMFLLTSVTLSVGVITLSKKRCLVQEMYSIEMLARVDTLCLDKTGTITDGTMSKADYIKLDRNYTEDKIKPIISSLISATKDDNFTAEALKKAYGEAEVYKAKTILPFSSETKCSAAYFDKLGTFAIGALGYIKISNKEETQEIVKKYSSKGYRCLIVCYSKSKIEQDKLPKMMTCVGVILLEDHIRDDAPQILSWFAENNVDIKVISGDDPITVSEIAKKAGIKNSNLYISLEGLSIDEVKKIATQYTIFGRVSPDQKEALVIALKEKGKTVAMTGDGVNDILALKRADCSIAMASGSDAAKNISQLVLLDSNFSVLTSVVAEGRRVINNIQRTSSLFLAKTFTSVVITLISVIAMFASKNIDLQFPLTINNFYIWETAFIGVGGFFLALEPNSKRIEGGFLSTALRKAIPAGLCIVSILTILYFLYVADFYDFTADNNVRSLLTYDVYSSIGDFAKEGQAFKAACAISMAFFGGVIFIRTCYPFSKFRIILVSVIVLLTIITLSAFFGWNITNSQTYNTFGGIYFGFEFTWMNLHVWLWTVLLILLGVIIYFASEKYLSKLKIFDALDRRVKSREEKYSRKA